MPVETGIHSAVRLICHAREDRHPHSRPAHQGLSSFAPVAKSGPKPRRSLRPARFFPRGGCHISIRDHGFPRHREACPHKGGGLNKSPQYLTSEKTSQPNCPSLLHYGSRIYYLWEEEQQTDPCSLSPQTLNRINHLLGNRSFTHVVTKQPDNDFLPGVYICDPSRSQGRKRKKGQLKPPDRPGRR